MSNNKLAIQINHKAFELIQEFNNDPEKRLRLYDLIFRSAFLGEEINDDDKAVELTAKSILYDIERCRNNYIDKCKKNPEMEEQARRRPELFSAIYDYIVSDFLNSWRAVYGDKEDRKVLYQEIKSEFEEVSEDNADNNKLINGAIKTIRENYFSEHEKNEKLWKN